MSDSGDYRIVANILGVKGRRLDEFNERRLRQIAKKPQLSNTDKEAISEYLESAAPRSPEANRARLRLLD